MRNTRFKQGTEPAWRPPDRGLRGRLSPALVSWLLDTDSLTRRLQQECGSGFRVEVIAQRWQRPMFSERAVLGMADAAFALVRQVRLLCGDRPLVYARTVMPAEVLKGARRRLACLGNRPLGGMLFADRRIERGPIEVAHITPLHALHRTTIRPLAGDVDVWGRRSIFRMEHHPLLVSEIFLPAIERHG